MIEDRLSEVFDVVEVSSVVTGGVAARGGWWSHGPLHDPVKFFAMVAGHARLTTDGSPDPIDLREGDVAVLIGRSWVAFEAGDEPRREIQPESDFSTVGFAAADRSSDDVLIGGCIELNQAGRALLLGAMPPVAHVRASDPGTERLRHTIARLSEEATGDRLGSAFAMRQYGRLLLVEVLRAYIDQSDRHLGLLGLLADQRLSPALALMHGEPGRAWQLEELARAAAMSRTSFAERFREVAGMPALQYLSRWRMLLAQRALREREVRVGELAEQLGYSSESAFSTAFKRRLGESPLHYRRRARASSAAA